MDCVPIKTTSGSTGRPKGVMRTSLSAALMIADYQIALPHQERPINLIVTPPTNVARRGCAPDFRLGRHAGDPAEH